jgi:hypothetical protein
MLERPPRRQEARRDKFRRYGARQRDGVVVVSVALKPGVVETLVRLQWLRPDGWAIDWLNDS